MYLIIGSDGNEYGPVNAEELRRWIKQGLANADTMTRHEEDAEWKPLGSFAEFLISPPAPVTSRPLAISRVPLRPQPQVETDDVEQAFRVGECLRNGLRLMGRAPLLILGATVVFFEIRMMISRYLPGGKFLNALLGGVMMGGLFWVCLKVIRRRQGTEHDVLEGFTRAFGSLVATGIATGLPWVIAGVFSGIQKSFPTGDGNSLRMVFGGFHAIALVVASYLQLVWIFGLPLAIDRLDTVRDVLTLSHKVVHENFGRMFCLLLAVVAIAGACVGLLFLLFHIAGAESIPRWVTMALRATGIVVVLASLSYGFASISCAYEQLFRRRSLS